MQKGKAYRVALTGMLFALCMALSWLESALAPLLGLMPAMKLGLANICIMYALLFLTPGTAFALAVLKAGFAFVTRGATAGLLSRRWRWATRRCCWWPASSSAPARRPSAARCSRRWPGPCRAWGKNSKKYSAFDLLTSPVWRGILEL